MCWRTVPVVPPPAKLHRPCRGENEKIWVKTRCRAGVSSRQYKATSSLLRLSDLQPALAMNQLSFHNQDVQCGREIHLDDRRLRLFRLEPDALCNRYILRRSL